MRARWQLPINFALYQAGWFACVLGAGAGRPWTGAALALLLVAVHLTLARDRGSELKLILAAGILGLAIDSLQLNAGVFNYPGGSPIAGLAPPWIVVLWLQFATLLHFGLKWLSRRYLLASVLGFVGGPLSFFAGERAGAIEFASLSAYGALACAWAVAMPTLVWLGDRLQPDENGYRGGSERGSDSLELRDAKWSPTSASSTRTPHRFAAMASTSSTG